MASPLQKEFDFYVANQDQLVREYDGKVIVIKDQRVIGAYDSEMEAVQATVKVHPLGTFLVQKCGPRVTKLILRRSTPAWPLHRCLHL